MNYICYIRNGRLQIENADSGGGRHSDATLHASDLGHPQRVHFNYPGRRPHNRQTQEALAYAAHNAWTLKYSDAPYQQGGIDVLHGRMRNVPYIKLQALAVVPEEDEENEEISPFSKYC